MRLSACALILTIGLAACAPPKKTDAGGAQEPLSCSEYPSAYNVQWPDNHLEKSTIANCPDGTYLVQSMNKSAAFSTSAPVIRIANAQGVYNYVEFSWVYAKP